MDVSACLAALFVSFGVYSLGPYVRYYCILRVLAENFNLELHLCAGWAVG